MTADWNYSGFEPATQQHGESTPRRDLPLSRRFEGRKGAVAASLAR